MACISYDQETALNVLQCLRELLAEVPNIFSDFDRNLFSINNEHILQSMEIRAAELCSILSILHADLVGLNIRGSIQIFGELRNALYELCTVAHRYRKQFQEFIEWSPLHGNVHAGTQFHLEKDIPASPGRPKVYLSREQVSALISLGFKFTDISNMLGVHPRTLRKMHREWELPIGEGLSSEVTDEELDKSTEEIFTSVAKYWRKIDDRGTCFKGNTCAENEN